MLYLLDCLPDRQKRFFFSVVPTLLIALISLVALTPVRAQNYLHASGAQVVDSHGVTVRLTGLNWFGLESNTYCPHGLWTRSMTSMLDQVKTLGYNVLRIPYSNQLFDAGSVPNGIDFSLNSDLQGLSGLQILDKLIAGCQARGLKVILDRHRPDAGGQSALWYTDHYSEQRWISDWQMLAMRYAGNDTVIGCDLHNEPHDPATWGSGDINTDWRLAAERCGNAILAVNPHLLIMVEGVQTVNGDGYWWGGNLTAAGAHPVELSVPNQLVYSTHDYPSTVSGQPWFSAPNYPANLPGVWDQHWGYLVKNNIAPVYVGEWGTRDETNTDQQWFQSLANYIGGNGLSFTYWCLNPNSGDTGGILEDDWQTVNQAKQSVIQPLLAPLIGSDGSGPTIPQKPTNLMARAGDGQVILSWNASSGNVLFNIYRGTKSGAEQLVKTGLINATYTDTGLTNGITYYYTVMAVNGVGSSLPSDEVSATPVSVGGSNGPVTAVATVTANSGPWWSEEDVVLHSTVPVTALTVTITAQRSAGVSYFGQYNTVGTTISSGHADVPNQIIYQFTLAPGQTLAAGTNPLFAAQFNGTGVAHSYGADTYTVIYTAGGTTTTLSGSFGGSASAPIAPAAPTNLTAKGGDGQVALSWSSSSGPNAGYNLYRATSAGAEGMTIYRSGLTATTYTDMAVMNGTTYYYSVAAVNSGGTSPLSAEASATPVSPGGSVTATATVTSNSGPWWSEEDVVLHSTVPVTALTVTITVPKSAGVSYSGQYNTVGPLIVSNYNDGSSSIVYQFTLAPGQTLAAGFYPLFAAQFNGSGLPHSYGADAYKVTYTAGGITNTVSGHF